MLLIKSKFMKHIKSFESLKNLFSKRKSDDDIAIAILKKVKSEKFDVRKFTIPGLTSGIEGFIKQVDIDDYLISVQKIIGILSKPSNSSFGYMLFIDSVKIDCRESISREIYLTLKNPVYIGSYPQSLSAAFNVESDEVEQYTKKDARMHFVK